MTDATLPAERDEIIIPYVEISGDEMSFEEYLTRFNSVEGVFTEWVGGKVEVSAVSNNTLHQEWIGILYMLFRLFLEQRSLGRVILAGLPMSFGDLKTARQPDLLIVLNEHLDRIQPTYLDGAADAVVEVISPESDARDRGAKFVQYESAGIKEYYLFDPIREEADLFRLGESGRYHRTELDAQGRFVSTVLPGFSFDPKILWRDQLPDTMEIIALVQAMVEKTE